MARWHRSRALLAESLNVWCAEAERIEAHLPALVLAQHGERAHDLPIVKAPAAHRLYFSGPNAAELLRNATIHRSYRIVQDVLSDGATDVVVFHRGSTVRIVHGALYALVAGPEATYLNVLESEVSALSPEALAAESFFHDLSLQAVVPSRTHLASPQERGEECIVELLNDAELQDALRALSDLIGASGERTVHGALGRPCVLALEPEGLLTLSETDGPHSAERVLKNTFHPDGWTLARSRARGGLIVCTAGSEDASSLGVPAIELGAFADGWFIGRLVATLSRAMARPVSSASVSLPPPKPASTHPDTVLANPPPPDSYPTSGNVESPAVEDLVTNAPLEDRIAFVHKALIGYGAIAREDAVRIAAFAFRDAKLVSFARLHPGSALSRSIDQAIEQGIRQGHFDRPRRGTVRATIRDLDEETARDCVVSAVHEGLSDREEVTRRAYETAQERYGLPSVRFRRDGKIHEALKSAINSAIRRRLIARRGAALAPADVSIVATMEEVGDGDA